MSVKAIAVNPNAPSTFIEITQPMPQPGEHDLLVEVKAVSINPVDTKVHAGIVKTVCRHRVFWDGMPVGSSKPSVQASRNSSPAMKCGMRVISLVQAVTPVTSLSTHGLSAISQPVLTGRQPPRCH